MKRWSLCFLTLFAISEVKALQIGQLVSTCVHACERGCVAIRSVQASREGKEGVGLKVELKDKNDPRSALTEADFASQLEVIGSLRRTWKEESDLRIVGEEDDSDIEDAIMKFINDETKSLLPTDLFDDDIGETADIDASTITVFVDPLDGTREFVENRLANCQVLVGVSIGGEAVAGAIGIPFPAGDLSVESTIVYGIADMGAGIRGSPLTRGPFPLDHHIDGVDYPRPHHATGDSNSIVMEACRKGAIKRFGGSNVIYGGAGNKILGAALGEVACSIQHKVGGPWDLCAPQAILNSMGGKMTNLFGEEISMEDEDAPKKGYIATPSGSEELFHEALAAALMALPEVQEYKTSLEEP